MDHEKKIQLGEKYRHSLLIQLLLFNVWARYILATLVLIVLVIALVLPKIWRTSPKGFSPKVRVSLLDMLQVRSLSQKAEKQVKESHYEASLDSWIAAWANNPANPNTSRGWLKALIHLPNPDKNAPNASFLTSWLLRLTQTNRQDLELGVQALYACKSYTEIFYLLKAQENELTPTLATSYLKSLFYLDQIPKFKDYLSRHEKQLAQDRELRLICLAYSASWESEPKASQAERELEVEAAKPDPLKLADNVLLRVAFKKSDLAGYERILARLTDARLDTLSTHLAYWHLLLTMGQKEKAVSLAQNSFIPPRNLADTLDLSGFYLKAGQTNQAMQSLTWHLEHLGFNERVNRVHADLLIETKDWPALNALALRTRGISGVSPSVINWTYYLEGRVELAAGRREFAEKAFETASEVSNDDPELAVEMGQQLLRLGYGKQAARIMSKLQEAFSQNLDFWVILSLAAAENKDAEIMEKAARKAYELAPHDPVVVNNYAAALLLGRKNSAEAINLTLLLLEKMPDYVPFKINHAEALLANGRLKEAERILFTIAPDKLSPVESQQYYFDCLQVYCNSGRFTEARQLLPKIDPKNLFPTQQTQFKVFEKQIAEVSSKN